MRFLMLLRAPGDPEKEAALKGLSRTVWPAAEAKRSG